MLGHLGLNVPHRQAAKRYWPRHFPQPYYATFWLDPWGFMLAAECHHERE
jgi:hypothetical protein